MSSRRIVVSSAAMATVIVAGSWYAVSAFPLQQAGQLVSAAPATAPGPLELRANPITPENPIPRRLMSENMLFPAEAAAVKAGGQMTLQVTLDELGRVAEARPTRFSITSPVMDVHTTLSVDMQDLRGILKRATVGVSAAPMLEVYDAIARAATDAVRQWRYDPPFKAPISFPVTFRFGSEPPPVELAFQVRPEPNISTAGAHRVGELGVSPPMKITDVKPVYPAIARAANVQGVVIMEARVEPDGSVSEAKVIKSIPLLDQAALDAVKQWRFTPTLLNGQPVAVIMTVTINFTLAESEKTPPPAPPASGPADKANLEPSWSPDRTKVGFEPSWSPDRTKLAFISNRDGKSEIYVVNRDGNGLRKLTNRPGQK